MKEIKIDLKNKSKKIYVLFAIIFLTVSICYPDTSASYEYSELVYDAQVKLKKLNYDIGNTDGLFGVKTKRAVCEFQKDNKLIVTCKLDELTINMLELVSIKEKYHYKNVRAVEKIKIIKNKTSDTIHSYEDKIENLIKYKKCDFLFIPFSILKNTGSSLEYIILQYLTLSYYCSSGKLEYKTIALYIFMLSPLAIALYFLSNETGDYTFIKIFYILLACCCLLFLYILIMGYFKINTPNDYFLGILLFAMAIASYFKKFSSKLLPYFIGIATYAFICIITILFSIKAYESLDQVYHKINSVDYLLVYKNFNELHFSKGLMILFSIMLLFIDFLYISTLKKRNFIKGTVINILIIYLTLWIIKSEMSLFTSIFTIVLFDIYLLIYYLYWNKIKKKFQYNMRLFLRNASYKYRLFCCVEFNIVIAPHISTLSLATYIMFYHPWIFRGIPGDKNDLSLFIISTFYFFIFQYVAIAIISYFTIYKSYIKGENIDDPDLGIPEPIDWLLSP